jgi:hypothetical protein
MGAQLVAALVGLWLIAAPDVLAYADPARTNDHFIGPIVAAVGLVAAAEVTRPVRAVNLLTGVWMVLVPGMFGYHSFAVLFHSVFVGVVLLVCARQRGRRRGRYGGGWRAVWQAPLAAVDGGR